MKKTVLSVIFERGMGLLLFLILLAIASNLENKISNTIYSQSIAFLNDNLGLIILFSAILFLGELFSILKFPFSMPYPIFNALGSVFLVAFLFGILDLLREMFIQDFFLPFYLLGLFIYPLVILVVLIVGYTSIVSGLSKESREIRTKKDKNWGKGAREIIENINDFMNKTNKAIFSKKRKR